MKNKLIKSLLLIPALLVGACGSSSNNSVESSIESSLDSSVSGGESLSIPEESSSQEKAYPNSVLTSPWGLEAAKASYDVLGVAIPYIEQASFKYEVGVDKFGDPDIWFYCYYETDEKAEQAYQDYLNICAAKGYSGNESTYTYVDYETLTYYQFNYCVVDRVIGPNQGVELQFLPSTWDGKPCLGIYGMSYLYIEETIYPQLAVERFYKDPSDVPVISGDYTYYFTFFVDDNDTKGLEIHVIGCDYDLEKYYFNELIKNNKFVIFQYSDDDEDYEEVLTKYEDYMYGYYYFAVSNEKYIIFYYDISNSMLVIDMYSRI